MKIATFNVNSIRKRLPIVLQWLKMNQPDVLCMQETKASDADFPAEAFREAGYEVTFLGNKGYSGVATASLQKPEKVQYGLDKGPDSEDARVLLTIIRGLPIINTYVPQGTAIGSERFAYKLAWFKRLKAFLNREFSPKKPLLWLGDLNVAPEPIDVYHPEKRLTDPCFHPEARKAYKATRAWGFRDLFREKYPERVQYTYWDYWRGMFEHNYGWRLDHLLATPSLAKLCRKIEVDLEPRQQKEPSDHTVVWAEFDWPTDNR